MRVWRRIMALALVLIMCVSLLPVTAAAAESGTCGTNVSWRIDGSVLTISGTGAMYDYDPDSNLSPFRNSSITSVVIEDGVTSIGAYAFYGCAELVSVTIPSGVTSIGALAFCGCEKLASIAIPSSVTSIGDAAFNFCLALTSVVIPSGVTSIAKDAFSYCSSLASVTIPEGVTSIGESAFAGCESLAAITLPSTVTSIGVAAFYYCSSLASVAIPASVTNIEVNLFHMCESLASVTIPEGVTSIGDGAFNGCALTSVTIPSSVTRIGDLAFSSCPLTSVTISEGVTSIGLRAFEYCALTSVTIPSSVTSIGFKAFSDCTSLKYIYGGENVVEAGTDIAGWTLWQKDREGGFATLGKSLIYYTGKDKNVTIPNGIVHIASSAFSECETLTSLTIPDSVVSIGDGAFASCSQLTSVIGAANVSGVGSGAFTNVPWAQQQEFLIIGNCLVEYNGSGGDVVIPAGVKHITDKAFYDRENITSVVIPDGVVSIGDHVFAHDFVHFIWGGSGPMPPDLELGVDCQLASVVVPDTVTSFGDSVFDLCSSSFSINYMGSKEEWAAITYGEENDDLSSARVRYNCFYDVLDPELWYHDAVYDASRNGIIAGIADNTFAPNDTLSWAQTVAFAVRLVQYRAGEPIYGAADQTGANWYDVYVTYALENGIITAVPENPNADITRGDAAVIFAAVFNYSLPTSEEPEGYFTDAAFIADELSGSMALLPIFAEYTLPIGEIEEGYFTDVASGTEVSDAIYELASAGIVTGKGDGVFGVNDTFLRCEIATIVARMALFHELTVFFSEF